jgi:cytochrome c peroxidase
LGIFFIKYKIINEVVRLFRCNIKLMQSNKVAFIFLITIVISCTPDEGVLVPITIEELDELIGVLPDQVIDPIDNPTTPDKVDLGKKLFWDPVLSGNFDVACATCHHPDKGWGDNLNRSIGVGGIGLGENRIGGIAVKRNAHTIINSAFNGIDVNGNYNPSNTVMFWDNRVMSLEEQSLVPIKSMEEMRGNIYSEEDAITIVSQRLIDIPEYVVLFNNAFGDNTIIDGDKISKAIAAYERTLIANNSRFDQYYSGDNNALSDIELQGLSAFIAMNCTACHGGPMFSDYELHDLGTPNDGVNDNGVNGQFRTPTLRNLSLTGPYFHNGTFTTLEEAVNFYDDFEQNDADAQSLNFDDDQVGAVVAFLRTLNDDNFDRTIPENVPSGLSVGGNIND